MRFIPVNGLLFKFLRAFILILVIPIILISTWIMNEYKKTLIAESSERIQNMSAQVFSHFESDISRASMAVGRKI